MRNRNVLIFSIVALMLTGVAGTREAAASAVVRDSVVLDGPQLRVSDIFSGTKSDAVVSPAPAPGRRLVFDRYALARIAKQHGVSWYPRSNYVQTVVTRDSRILGADEVETALRRALVDGGMSKDRKIELTNRGLSIPVATNIGHAFDIENATFDDRTDHATAILAVNADDGSTTRYRLDAVTYTVTDIPVLGRRIRRGETIEKSDVIWKQVRKDTVGRNVITARDGVVGQAARRYLSPGQPLQIDDVEAPKIIRKGAIVTIVYKIANLELTAKARANEDGAYNDTIRVVNIRSKRTIEAIVRSPTQVVIPTDYVASN